MLINQWHLAGLVQMSNVHRIKYFYKKYVEHWKCVKDKDNFNDEVDWSQYIYSSYLHNIHCYERKYLTKLLIQNRQQILCCDFTLLWKLTLCVSVFLQRYQKQPIDANVSNPVRQADKDMAQGCWMTVNCQCRHWNNGSGKSIKP